MPKERTTPEASAAAFGVGHIVRHMFVCGGPDCVDAEKGEETWHYVKDRLKALNLCFAKNALYLEPPEPVKL